MTGNHAQNGNALWWTLLLAALVAGGAWYWFFIRQEAAVEPEPPPVVMAPPIEVVPVRPEPEESTQPLAETRTEEPVEQEPPLPALGESDPAARESAETLFGEASAGQLFITEGLVSKLVAALDALTLENVPENIVPLRRPGDAFVAEPDGVSETVNPETGLREELYVLSAANFDRYTAQVEMFEAADTDTLVAEYLRFYPLLQQSYQELRPGAEFNDRVVEVIDHLMAAPEPDHPVRLVKPEAFYEFADPQLEALSAGQKLMVRIGPSNAARIRAKLGEVRAALAQTQRE